VDAPFYLLVLKIVTYFRPLFFFTVRYVTGIDRRDAVSSIGPDSTLQQISLAGTPQPRMVSRDS